MAMKETHSRNHNLNESLRVLQVRRGAQRTGCRGRGGVIRGAQSIFGPKTANPCAASQSSGESVAHDGQATAASATRIVQQRNPKNEHCCARVRACARSTRPRFVAVGEFDGKWTLSYYGD